MQFPVYLDYAATTPLLPDAFEAMLPYLQEQFGNPSSLYALGLNANSALHEAREQVADLISCFPEEIIFTSGGTESNQIALYGAAMASQARRGKHILSSRTEHHAVLHPLERLSDLGWDIELLGVDNYGSVAPQLLSSKITPATTLVSIMHSNNEVGTLNPTADYASLCKERGVLLHTDAIQSVGHINVSVDNLGCDLLSLASHKFYGPKGAGALYVRSGTPLFALFTGGAQEAGLRGGTQNVAACVGMGVAAAAAKSEMMSEAARLVALRDDFIKRVVNTVPRCYLMGNPSLRLPNNAHFCVDSVEGASLVLALDAFGVMSSAGAACSAGSTEPSHVLLAMGVSADLARGAVRFSLGKDSDQETIDYTVSCLARSVEELRKLKS